MSVQGLYNILESEIDAGRLTLDSEVCLESIYIGYFGYDFTCNVDVNSYDIKDNTLHLQGII